MGLREDIEALETSWSLHRNKLVSQESVIEAVERYSYHLTDRQGWEIRDLLTQFRHSLSDGARLTGDAVLREKAVRCEELAKLFE